MRDIRPGTAGGWTYDVPDTIYNTGGVQSQYHPYHPDYGYTTNYGVKTRNKIPVTHSVGHDISGGQTQSVKQLQQMLRNKGYNIAVDGVRGTQTNAAIAAYHQGISAKAWNARSAHAGAKSGSGGAMPQPGRGGKATPPRRTVAGRGTNIHGNAVQAANAATAGTALDSGGGSSSTSYEEQARQLAEQEFGPQIAYIQAQQAAARLAAQQQIAGIKQTYGDIGNTATNIGQQTQQSDAALLAAQQEANQGMVNLFGGPGANGPAGEAAAFADINNAALQQAAAADQSYTKNLVPIIATQGAEAGQAAQNAANASDADYAAQVAELQGRKGAAYTSHLMDIQSAAADAQQKQDALDLARQLAPAKIAKANADAKLATFKAGNAPAEARMKAKQFGMSVQRWNASLAQTRARTAQIKAKMAADAAKNANGGIDWNDPNTRSSLFDQLRPIVQTKNGTWSMHPGAAQQNLNLALQTLGLANNPQARTIANQLLQQTVTNSHARKMWGQFNYANGKIVKTGKRYKPKGK